VKRRRGQASERRSQDVERHRTNERERQQSCRKRRRPEGRRVTESALSRAGLDADSLPEKANREDFWNGGRRVTRAGLIAKVASAQAYLRDLAEILGQTNGPVTRRPDRAGPHQERV
jgi:hypothetical protein